MSNAIVNRIRSADLPPTEKFILWIISDIANDAGFTADYAPIPRLQKESGFSRQTVISAIKRLEDQNIIKADRSNGRLTAYSVNPEYNISAAKPVNLLDGYNSYTGQTVMQTSLTDKGNQSNWHMQPVKEVDSIHHIPLIPLIPQTPDVEKTEKQDKPKKAKVDPLAIDLPPTIDKKTWAEFIAMRKDIKKPVNTERMVTGLLNQLAKMQNPNASLQQSIDNCWTGVFAVKGGSAYAQQPSQPVQAAVEPLTQTIKHKYATHDTVADPAALARLRSML